MLGAALLAGVGGNPQVHLEVDRFEAGGDGLVHRQAAACVDLAANTAFALHGDRTGLERARQAVTRRLIDVVG